MQKKSPSPVAQRRKKHFENHPNDKNKRNPEKGVTWSKKTERWKKLQQFPSHDQNLALLLNTFHMLSFFFTSDVNPFLFHGSVCISPNVVLMKLL